MRMPSSDTISPEKRLLILCARTNVPPAVGQAIRSLAAGQLDWNLLFSDATENSVMPLLARNLSAFADGVVRLEQAKHLADATRANAARSLILSAELIQIMDLFGKAGIRAIPYKGPVLAVQAYGDVTLREFEDLDIILRQSDMPRANEIVTNLGYRPKFPWILSRKAASSLVPGEYNYSDKSRRMMIELHTELTLRYFPVPPDIAALAEQVVPVVISSHEIWTFAPEDALPALCIHGSKDFWERVSWIADVAEMMRMYPSLDWDSVFRRAESWKAQRMLHLGLALAESLLDAPLPPEVSVRVQVDQAATDLAAAVIKRLLSWDYRGLGAVGRFRFRRHLIEEPFAGLRYSWKLATVPAEEDWEMIPLPQALSPLYVALRPLRLLRKYGLRSERVSGS